MALLLAAIAVVGEPRIASAIGATGNGPMVFESGTYTPTLQTGSINVSSATFYNSHWSRVGDIVTISGYAGVTATSANTFSQIELSLPSAPSHK
jgi:hypothetical protein